MEKKKCGSGEIFERQVLELLKSQGWDVDKSISLGKRLGKKSEYKVDLVAGNESSCIAISCKYQDTPGTAIDKIPYEYMSLLHAVEKNNISKGYIVVFGKELEGQHILNSGLFEMAEYMRVSPKVVVVTLQEFQSMILRKEIELPESKQLRMEL